MTLWFVNHRPKVRRGSHAKRWLHAMDWWILSARLGSHRSPGTACRKGTGHYASTLGSNHQVMPCLSRSSQTSVFRQLAVTTPTALNYGFSQRRQGSRGSEFLSPIAIRGAVPAAPGAGSEKARYAGHGSQGKRERISIQLRMTQTCTFPANLPGTEFCETGVRHQSLHVLQREDLTAGG